jgi:hypothetical protein
MIALNQWSKRSFVMVAAICLTGGFLIGSSSSQDVTRRGSNGAEAGRRKDGPEVGRYQMVGGPGAKIIFDTVTARFWEEKNYTETGESRWTEHAAPWAKGNQ